MAALLTQQWSWKIQGNASRIFSLNRLTINRIRQERRQRVVDVQHTYVGASHASTVRLILRGHCTNGQDAFRAHLPRCHENQSRVHLR